MRHLLYIFGVLFLSANLAMAVDFSGQWESDFGLVSLEQSGHTVTGTYACCDGTINGKVNGNRLEFEWSDFVYGQGWGVFTMSADGNRLDGVWGYAGQEKANGSWLAKRFAAPTPRGTPTYWTVSGLNAQAGALTGSAELLIQGDRVSGKIEGTYAGTVPGQRREVFNYVEGTVSLDTIHLVWRNPLDGSTGTADLARTGDEWLGSWVRNNGKSQGQIRLSKTPAKEDPVRLESVLEANVKRQRANKLLHEAAESASSEEVVRKYQEAEMLFRGLDDPNKVGYALYGQATDAMVQNQYARAEQLYQQVIDLGDAVDPDIRDLAQLGLQMVLAEAPRQSKGSSRDDDPKPVTSSPHDLNAQSKSTLKFKAFELTLHGQEGCAQALPMLERTLMLYRLDRGDASRSRLIREGSLIDEINILTRLAYCRLMLDQDHGFARSIVELVKVREEVSRVPYLTRFANPAGGPFQQIASFADIWRGRFETDPDKKQATERIRQELDEAVRYLAQAGNVAEALVLSENMRGRAFGDLLASKKLLMEDIASGTADTSKLPSPETTEYLPLSRLLEIVEASASTTIVYHVLDDQLLIWVVSPRVDKKQRIEMLTVSGGDRVLRPLVQSLKRLVYTRNKRGEIRVNQDALLGIFQDLRRNLIAPIPAHLFPPETGTLTVIPHGVLFNVPFAALARAGANETDFLVERYAVAFSPSIAILGRLQDTERQERRRNLLALVNPKPLPDVAAGSPELALTEENVAKITEFYPDQTANAVFSADKATPRVLLNDADRYSVVYFATHAQADDNDPFESWIALSGAGDAGRVAIPHILKSKLNAELVILAACETGAGKITGDGVDGLGRAFLFAGSKSLLTSLWEAGEETTLELMYNFHRHWLTEGFSKAEALRRAQLKIKDNLHGQPDSWANFVIVGDWR